MQAIELSESQQDFARCIGYEVALKDGGTGINLGLYFPDTWAADGIIKPNGVNVFFPDQNKIFVQNFGQVELVFPADVKPYTIPLKIDTSQIMDELTTIEEKAEQVSRKLRELIELNKGKCNGDLHVMD